MCERFGYARLIPNDIPAFNRFILNSDFELVLCKF